MYKVGAKPKRARLTNTNVIKSSEMTSNSKYRKKKWTTKDTETRKNVTLTDENLVLQRIVRKCKLI